MLFESIQRFWAPVNLCLLSENRFFVARLSVPHGPSLGDRLMRFEQNCDLVIAGRYDSSKRNIDQQWRGSCNQTLIYTKGSRIKEQPQNSNEVEVIIDEWGSFTVLGYPKDREGHSLLGMPSLEQEEAFTK